MGVRSCSDDEKFTPLEAAVKQASDDEVVFFVTQLGKCAVGSPYQLYIPKYFVEYCARRNWELKQNQKLLLEGYEIGFWWKVIVLVNRSSPSRGQDSEILSARIGKGWRDFAQGNAVEIGDKVLFTLVHTNRFVVKFFDADGKRKKKKQQGLTCLALGAVAKLSDKKSAARSRKQQFDIMMKDRKLSAAATIQDQMRMTMMPRKMTMPRRKFVAILDRSSDEEEEVEEEELGVPWVRRAVADARDQQQHTVVDKKINPKRLGDRQLIHAHEVKYMSKRPRDVTEEERIKAIVAARACAKDLPNISLMLVLRSSEVYHDFHLEMPAQFIREIKLQLPSSSSRRSWVALLDRDNKSWEVLTRQVIEQSGQQQNYCLLLSPKGWARFALDHVLEEGDACVFELVSNSLELPVFRVHIFRVLPMAVADSANIHSSVNPNQTSDRKILNMGTGANQSHDHELGNKGECNRRCPETAAAGIKLPSTINTCSSLVRNHPKPEPVLMEGGWCSNFNDGSTTTTTTTTTTSGRWRTTTVGYTLGSVMQHNQSPTGAAAPAPGSRSCCDQQANDLAAYAHCRTQAQGDDEQHLYMQSKLFAANDHEQDHYEAQAASQRRETVASILQKPSTWRNPHYDTLLETFG
ncbi:unnamed protein product [Sphagnum balticum]